jgi:hypothetical protein
MTRVLRDMAAFAAVAGFSVMVGMWSEAVVYLM